jgi:hypothetical protein
MVISFEKWHLSTVVMYLIGLIEIGIAIAVFYKPWQNVGIIALIVLMIGAISIHFIHKEYGQLYGPSLVLVLALLLKFTKDKL